MMVLVLLHPIVFSVLVMLLLHPEICSVMVLELLHPEALGCRNIVLGDNDHCFVSRNQLYDYLKYEGVVMG